MTRSGDPVQGFMLTGGVGVQKAAPPGQLVVVVDPVQGFGRVRVARVVIDGGYDDVIRLSAPFGSTTCTVQLLSKVPAGEECQGVSPQRSCPH